MFCLLEHMMPVLLYLLERCERIVRRLWRLHTIISTPKRISNQTGLTLNSSIGEMDRGPCGLSLAGGNGWTEG